MSLPSLLTPSHWTRDYNLIGSESNGGRDLCTWSKAISVVEVFLPWHQGNATFQACPRENWSRSRLKEKSLHSDQHICHTGRMRATFWMFKVETPLDGRTAHRCALGGHVGGPAPCSARQSPPLAIANNAYTTPITVRTAIYVLLAPLLLDDWIYNSKINTKHCNWLLAIRILAAYLLV